VRGKSGTIVAFIDNKHRSVFYNKNFVVKDGSKSASRIRERNLSVSAPVNTN
jgi:hypothetical protein